MAASVASSLGPGFVVGFKRPARFSARPKVVRVVVDEVRSVPARRPVSEFAPVARRVQAPASPLPLPMRRRFETARPGAPAPVSPRSRRIERPAPGAARVRVRSRGVATRIPVASRAGAAPKKIRLTRRGRVLAFVVLAIAVYAAFGLGRASAGGASSPTHATSVVVQPGDSLWTIAVRALPGSDPRDVVGELRSINHLSSADLAVGQRLRLP
jgi:nucleoid-associated protein YgaU